MTESGEKSNDILSESKDIVTIPKRYRLWIEELIKNGNITVIQSHKKSKYDTEETPALIHYRYNDGRKFEFVRCSFCDTILSSKAGGHWMKHQMKNCMVGSKNRSEIVECQESVRKAIVDYCLTTGSSFLHLESKPFRDLLRSCMSSMSGSTSAGDIKLPCRQNIRDSVKNKCLGYVKEIGEKIRKNIAHGNATLVLDFGLHIYNFLSVFVTYIDFDEKGVPFLVVLPFCFKPVYVMKTSENVRDEIVRCGSRFGLVSDEILSLSVVSDGAANVSSMGKKYFANWSLCACHSLQKMSERILNPKVCKRSQYTDHEMDLLNQSSALLEKCGKLAVLVHKHKSDLRITKLPNLYVDTRWQSLVRCAKDVLNLLPLLKESRIQKIAEVADDIDGDNTHLQHSIEVLEKFDPLVSFFEESSTSIHLYLPLVYDLYYQFLQVEKETDDEFVRTINKSGRIVTYDYLENKISAIHLKATILSPRLKKMSRLSKDHQTEAIQLVKDDLEKLDASKLDRKTQKPPPCKRARFEFLYDDIEDTVGTDEFDTYMAEKVTENTPQCPLQYWTSKKQELPMMSKIAFRVFSTLSSEAICERAFSAVKRVVRDDRHRLEPDLVELIMIGYFYANSTK